MTTRKVLLTADDLAALPAREDGRHFELHRGELVEMSPTGFIHGIVTGRLALLIGSFATAHDLGVMLTGEPGVTTERAPDSVLAPDVAYYSWPRVPRPLPRRGFTDAIPDLCVEVASPDDRPGAIARKTHRWLEAGALLVWNVDPARRTIEAAYADGRRRTFVADDMLDAEPLLPGFHTPVAALFTLPGERA